MPLHENRIALLIDADNAPASRITRILTEVTRRGTPHIQRAYGNWKSPQLKPWEDVLHKNAIQPIQQFAYTAGKNATDIAMTIDAMDLLHTRPVDAFALVSSDADFTPLVMRLRAGGVKVYGFGEQKTPPPYKRACSDFIFLDEPVTPKPDGGKPQSGAAAPTPKTRKIRDLRGDTHHLQMLRSVIKTSENDDGWAHLGMVGQQIAKQDSFDSRNYGYSKLGSLVEASGLFEVKRQNGAFFVKDNRRK